LGFPIRKSPDRRLLASPRGLSQLTTSFIACLRQGIHTHALSSLTIKSNSNTNFKMSISCACPLSGRDVPLNYKSFCRQIAALLVVNNARQIFDCQRSDFFAAGSPAVAEEIENYLICCQTRLPSVSYRIKFLCMVGLGRFELPTSPLSGVRSNQLSYRP
jgi:hypothetical protein